MSMGAPYDDELLQSLCPQCGVWVTELDGFGVLAHIKPVDSDGCGYCSHPSWLDGVCSICGLTEARAGRS